jgi:hypothetical protein
MAGEVCRVGDACLWCGLEFGRGCLEQLEYSLAEPKCANPNQFKRAFDVGSRAESFLAVKSDLYFDLELELVVHVKYTVL